MSDYCRLSILIVSYNTCEMTLACLESLYETEINMSYEVIVVDNDSLDGSQAEIAARFPSVRMIALKENIGFARANNLAAKYASGEYILLLNPDTVILGDAIKRVVKFAARKPGFRVYGGRTLYADGRLNPTSCWGSMTLWSLTCNTFGLRKLFPNSQLFNPEGIGGWQRDTVREVGVVTGCFLLIERSLWERLAGFNPKYFMYAEEADLCMRARALGARPIICPEATIIHHGSASDPVAWEKQIKVLKGKVTLMRDHWSWAARVLGMGLLIYRALNHAIAYHILAFFLRREELRERALSFSKIWKNRQNWLAGYE